MDEEEVNHATTSDPVEVGPDYPYSILQDGPLDIALLQERALTIREGLYPADREVFDLLIDGENSDEIAEILGRTEKAVERSLSRIRSLT